MCNSDRESIPHCFVECPIARASWNCIGIGVNTHVEGTFASWLAALFQSHDGDQLKVIAMICWALWHVKNDSVWKGKQSRVASVCNLAKCTLYQWTKAQDKLEVSTTAFLTKEDGAEKWIKPAREL